MAFLFLAVIQIPEEALQKSSYVELAPLLCAGTTVYGAIHSSKWNPGDIAIVQGAGKSRRFDDQEMHFSNPFNR